MHPLSLLIKPASSNCNLQCEYCFYHSLAAERKDYSFGMMSDEIADEVIGKSIEFAKDYSISYAFQGGEPLLRGKDFFINFAEEVNNSIGKGKASFSMQTNGTLIDEEWCNIFSKYNFLIGLSLDGSKNTNSQRVYKDGSNSYDNIIYASKLLKEHKVDFNILTVVTRKIYESIEEIYASYKENGFKHLQFIQCLKPFDGEFDNSIYLNPREYGDFLIRLFRMYYKDIINNEYVSIRQLDNWVRLTAGQTAEQCGMNGHCTYQTVIEGNGNLYPCDFFCKDELCLGNIKTTDFFSLDKNKMAIDFIKESLITPKRCKACNYYKLCYKGGCKRYRLDDDYCESYKMFFENCISCLIDISKSYKY